MFNEMEITGRERTHVVQVNKPRFAAHHQVVEAFLKMKASAAKNGFDLEPFSTFRDYKTQLRIWNHKYLGRKPLYDINGNVRDFNLLTEDQIISHILDWSALPGGSRHQWGTEVDVVDRAVMTLNYNPKLLPEETVKGGIFYDLHCWLDDNINKFGFFRPYKYYKGGMFPEPWHLSYAPISMKAINCVNVDLLIKITKESDILGKDKVLNLIPEIYTNHILNYVKPEEQ